MNISLAWHLNPAAYNNKYLLLCFDLPKVKALSKDDIFEMLSNLHHFRLMIEDTKSICRQITSSTKR